MIPGAPIPRAPRVPGSGRGRPTPFVPPVFRPFLALGLAAAALVAADAPTPAAWTPFEGGRWLPLAAANGSNGFTQVAPSASGLTFTNHLADASAADNRVLENGSGVALGDVDGDGLPDVYFCRLEGPNALYRNLGNGKFQETAARAGVDRISFYGIAVAAGDYDNDDYPDLLVTGFPERALFHNNRDGTFANVSAETGIDAAPEGGCALAVLESLVRSGRISPSSEVVLYNTGSGASYRA